MKVLRAALVSSVFCVSCGAASPPKDLRPIVANKAAFELSCSADQLKITELSDASQENMGAVSDAKTFGVEGCGKRASYNAWCVKPMMMDESCGATQTSAPIASPAPSAAPAAAPAP